MGFKKKARLAQIDRWKKIKQAQLQDIEKIKKEEPEQVPEQCLYEAFQQCNFEPAPELQQVIKTESIEIFHELLPPEEPPAETPKTQFCCLCLRIYHPAKFVQFSSQQSWNCLDVVQVQEQLTSVLGLEIDLTEQDALCRSCWALTELLADFRTCCRKAAEWRERFSTGIVPKDTSREDHLNKHKGIKPYKCRRENCNHHSYTVKERIHHEKICGKDKPICPECGLQLASPDTLKAHLGTHRAAAHPCDICDKLFKSKITLKKHRLIHAEDRDYFPCSVCEKSLKSMAALRVHMRIHTQEKPHACHICGQGFAYKCLVKPHIKRCH
ncbi:hypothetical protein pipiens_006082 [Culex pipiens pipiens]|uniref:C2H2-type domain-containing protein n=1 Tax=Culex pipiens pipiens TaxID=38569 RepID=A0ABD1DRU2_CULPP